METKVCSKCGEEKPFTDFYKNRMCKDGYRTFFTIISITIFTDFYKNRMCKDGYRNYCKKCCGISQQKYNESVRETFLQNKREKYQKNKEKISNQKRDYYNTNRPIILERVKNWKIDNPTKVKEWKEENKENINQSQKEYREKRMETDVLFRTTIHLRKLIGGSFNRRNWTKNSKTFDILGCDVETFIQHIENQFQDGMNWDNYGKKGWNYDHIIPLASATTEEEIYKLNHYTNFQPLWWHENLSKGDKLPEELLSENTSN